MYRGGIIINYNLPKGFEVTALSKHIIQSQINNILNIDKSCFGTINVWDEESYVIDLPSKWDISSAVLFEGRIVGLLVSSIYENQMAHIHRLAVDPDFQKQGVGSMLFFSLENHCSKLGIKHITVEYDRTLNVWQFYKKLGFRKLSVDEVDTYIHSKGKQYAREKYIPIEESSRHVLMKSLNIG